MALPFRSSGNDRTRRPFCCATVPFPASTFQDYKGCLACFLFPALTSRLGVITLAMSAAEPGERNWFDTGRKRPTHETGDQHRAARESGGSVLPIADSAEWRPGGAPYHGGATSGPEAAVGRLGLRRSRERFRFLDPFLDLRQVWGMMGDVLLVVDLFKLRVEIISLPVL